MPGGAHPRRRMLGARLHRWHRRLGVGVCVFVLWLVASGWALNHTQALGLNDVGVSAPWLTRWYGLHAVALDHGYAAGGHWLVGNEQASALDGRLIAPALPQPVGLAAQGPFLFAANASGIAVFDAQGNAVDWLRASDLGVESLVRLGQAGRQVVIADIHGRMVASADGTTWKHYSGAASWSTLAPVPANVRTAAQRALAPRIPLERVIQDAHSGRLLGSYGPWLVDGVGLIFVFLASTGLWMYLRRRIHPGRHLRR